MKQHVIYGLLDPNTKELRYVGYTSNLKKRMGGHYGRYSLSHRTHKNNWLKSLLAIGQKAEAIILEERPKADDLPSAEIEMIAYLKSIGCNLTNGTEGGDGGAPMKGKKHSEKSKQKISTSQKNAPEEVKQARSKRLKDNPIHLGHNHSRETKTKMSKSHIGKHNIKHGAKINNAWINRLRNLLNLRPLA